MMLSIALAIVLFSIDQVLVLALNLKNVKLISENLHYTLTWESDNLQECTHYEAEIRSNTIYKTWTKMDLTCGNVSFSCTCDLSQYMNDSDRDIYDHFEARVRFINSTNVSKWKTSNQLHPFNNSILGPPVLALFLQDHNLTVNISMPLTRYCQGGACMAVHEVLTIINYEIIWYEGDRRLRTDIRNSFGKNITYSFEYQKAPSNYCVSVGVQNQKGSSQKCIEIPPNPPDVQLICVMIFAVLIIIILSFVGFIYFTIKYIHSSPSKMQLPRTLEIINEEITMNLCTKNDLDFQSDSISIVSMVVYYLEEDSKLEQKISKIQLLPEKYDVQQGDSYQNNGFGPGYCDNDAYTHRSSSWSFSQMDYTGTMDVNNPHPALSVEMMKDNYLGNKNYSVASAIQPPLGLHVYSEPFLPVSSTLLQENMKKDLCYDRARELLTYQLNIPLNSVKFQTTEDTLNFIAEDYYDPLKDDAMKDNSPDTSSVDSTSDGGLECIHKPQVEHMCSAGLDAKIHDCDTCLKTQDSQFLTFSGYELRDIPLSICTDHETYAET
ncbi:interleukin-20 receptor subunit alpha-like [Rhinatrema bivittatum]|uniref:interleukin-20 receptor subunit alpha-like n=1 Tax=Rhinatrema bivittatum TaxID=194408 RepID=UPI00112600A9|nr:interleukin-20 receptor subunit alpha-like [Rhinatrema bivittatum]